MTNSMRCPLLMKISKININFTNLLSNNFPFTIVDMKIWFDLLPRLIGENFLYFMRHPIERNHNDAIKDTSNLNNTRLRYSFIYAEFQTHFVCI